MNNILLLSLALSVLACATEKEPITGVDTKPSAVQTADVYAERTDDGIRLTNKGSKTILYIARNEGWLGLLAGCHDMPSTCAALATGESVVIRNADIIGFDARGVLEVWYWVDGTSDRGGSRIRLPLD